MRSCPCLRRQYGRKQLYSYRALVIMKWHCLNKWCGLGCDCLVFSGHWMHCEESALQVKPFSWHTALRLSLFHVWVALPTGRRTRTPSVQIKESQIVTCMMCLHWDSKLSSSPPVPPCPTILLEGESRLHGAIISSSVHNTSLLHSHNCVG